MDYLHFSVLIQISTLTQKILKLSKKGDKYDMIALYTLISFLAVYVSMHECTNNCPSLPFLAVNILLL